MASQVLQTPEPRPAPNDEQPVLRSYQRALITIAQEKNIIACLPTGAGKTLIALKLSNTYFEPVKMNGKKIIFIACTVPLLRQQHEQFQKHTVFQCNAFSGTGTETFDTANRNKFMEKYKSCEVILMTPQYFLNLLIGGFIQFEDICLLIFDECHHAVKGDAIRQVMKLYSEMKEYKQVKNEEYPALPRILGLTATVISKNVDIDGLPDEISSVEKRLDCVAVSHPILEEVLAHSTNALAECMKYTLSELQFPGYKEEEYLAPLKSAVKFFRSLPKEFKYDKHHKKAHPLVSNRWLFNGKAIGDGLATLLEECILLSPSLGPFALMHLAVCKIRHLKDKIKNTAGEEEGILKMYGVAHTALIHFLVRARVVFPMAFENGNIENLLSNKILKVLEILQEYREKSETEDCLCGLLFVGRRTIAIALKEVFAQLKRADPEKFGFIRAAVVIGANAGSKMSAVDRIKPREQTDIMKKFRSKELNLLICTSVLEEGIDVAACNLVIRFDAVNSFTSYMQSMGRARKKNAKYYVLLHSEEYDNGCGLVSKFEKLNQLLNETLRSKINKIGVNDGSEDDEEPEEIDDNDITLYVPDFCPNGPLMARVTAYTCVSLCYRYANTICSNTVKCWNWCDQCYEVKGLTEKRKYQVSIKLPPGSAVDNVIIKGPPMPSKIIAKKAVFMKACKEIYAGGGFDPNFLPLLPNQPSDMIPRMNGLLI